MRTSISCAWCRRAKIKCHHNGTAPCRSCIKNSRSCVLSGPQTGQFRMYKSNVLGSTKATYSGTELQLAPEVQTVTEGIKNSASNSSINSLLIPTPDVLSMTLTPNQEDGLLEGIPKATIIHGCRIFVKRFPEFSFIHTPTFFEDLRKGRYHYFKVCAMLALSAKFIPDLNIKETALDAGEVYAHFVRRELIGLSLRKVDIDTIQCLLMLGLYDWGRCSGYQAWMYIGMAIRMVQGLKFEQSAINASGQDGPLQLEIQNRTIWSCFLMDQLLSSGKQRPVTLDKEAMEIPLPVSDDDFIFAEFNTPQPRISQVFSATHTFPAQRPSDYYFSLILQGVDIWAELSKWVGDGGRRATHGPEDCPWKPHSPWGRINQRLQQWWMRLGSKIRYPPAGLEVHIQRGHGNSFTFINLIYYICQIFLHREFVPFFPISVSGPQGPIERPFFQSDPPAGWWNTSAETLFHAAECITMILSALKEADAPLMTPFVGFCAFTAATMNCYIEEFPHMSPQSNTGAKERFQKDIAYINEFSKMWKIGEGWQSTILTLHRLWIRAKSHRQKFSQKGRDDFRELEDSMQEYGSISLSDNSVQAVETLFHAPSGDLSHINDDTSRITPYTENGSVPLDSLPDDFFSEEDWDACNWTGENSLTGYGDLMGFGAGSEYYMPERFENFMFRNHDRTE